CYFFCIGTPTTEIYTLSLHDALPIWVGVAPEEGPVEDRHQSGQGLRFDRPELRRVEEPQGDGVEPLGVTIRAQEVHPRVPARGLDRKSTRLNSSHDQISYAVFCLKKK